MAGVDLAQKVRPRCWGKSLMRSEGLNATVPTFTPHSRHRHPVAAILGAGAAPAQPPALGSPSPAVSDVPLPCLFPPSQGDQQERSLERLCLSDRSSLLSEIQALRAQLRMTHLQNQEKLQQLCTALTSAEARGSRQEHRLRRQGGCGPGTHPPAGAGATAGPPLPGPPSAWPARRPGACAHTSGLSLRVFCTSVPEVYSFFLLISVSG